MRLNADLKPGRSLVSHPRREAGKGAVKLVDYEKRGAPSLKPPPNAYRLAETRMKSVGDACFSLLFAGSMSPFQNPFCCLDFIALSERRNDFSPTPDWRPAVPYETSRRC